MKNINRIFASLLAVNSLFFFPSCDKEEEKIVLTFEVPAATTGLVFMAEGSDSQTIEFVANGQWNATYSASWFNITPRTGNGAGVIEVTVVDNATFDQRQGDITIRDTETGISQKVTVTQGAKDQSLVFSKEMASLTISDVCISDTVNVAGNYAWEISEISEWLSYEFIEENLSQNSRTIVFYADMTKLSHIEETGEVVFKGNNNNIKDTHYPVYYPGFEPIVSLKSGLGLSFIDVVDNTFDFNISSSNVIRIGLEITANYEYELTELDHRITRVQNQNEDVKIQSGVSAKRKYFVYYDADSIYTEDIYANITLRATDLEGIDDVNLKGRVKGVGSEYLSTDYSNFKRNDIGFLYLEGGSRDSNGEATGYLSETLKISTSYPLSNNESEWPFSIIVTECKGGIPFYSTTQIRDSWVYVTKMPEETKVPIATTDFQVRVGVRGEDESDFAPSNERQFALFIIPKSLGVVSAEELFDENGTVKRDYSSLFRAISQNGVEATYNFICPQMPENILEIDANTKEAYIEVYDENVPVSLGFRFFTDYRILNNRVLGKGRPYNDLIIEDVEYEFKDLKNTLKITFNPNTTSSERRGTYGFGINFYNEYLPGYSFDIIQKASNE